MTNDNFIKTAMVCALKFQQILYEYGLQQKHHPDKGDWLHLGEGFWLVMQKLGSQPDKLLKSQMSLWQKYHQIATNIEQSTQTKDKRFLHKNWQIPLFYFLKEAYIATCEVVYESIKNVNDIDQKIIQQALFYARQWLDALSPSNFFWSNPEVLELTLQTAGDNLLKGLDNVLQDIKNHQLHIKMTDFSAFQMGKNVATTQGVVIYQNELMQLIQYTSTTKKVFKRPLLIVPPWINKYYILDLSPEKSLVKWLVNQGYSVFMISWVNPDASHAHITFADYIFKGPLAALQVIEQAVGQKSVNALGFCIGGTLLAATMAYLAAKRDKRIISATYLATLLDFSQPGELGVFISEEKLAIIDAYAAALGYFPGRDLAGIFNLLRDNDLIWPYYVNNYLKGKQPVAFDLLYWNADFTNLPCKMYHYYLSNMYVYNRLCQPNVLSVDNTPIDLKNISAPSYFIATKEDHIAPWQSVYAAVHLLSGPVRFVLGASGHIAGIVNPPHLYKYNHWTAEILPASAQQWLEAATSQAGSWWVDWEQWLKQHSGAKITPVAASLPPIEPAPGSYVQKKAL